MSTVDGETIRQVSQGVTGQSGHLAGSKDCQGYVGSVLQTA